MDRPKPFFPQSRDIPRVDDRRVWWGALLHVQAENKVWLTLFSANARPGLLLPEHRSTGAPEGRGLGCLKPFVQALRGLCVKAAGRSGLQEQWHRYPP